MYLLADSELTTQTVWIAAGTIIGAVGVMAVIFGAVWVGGKLAGLLEASQRRLDENDTEHREFRETFMDHTERIGTLEGWRDGGGHRRGHP